MTAPSQRMAPQRTMSSLPPGVLPSSLYVITTVSRLLSSSPVMNCACSPTANRSRQIAVAIATAFPAIGLVELNPETLSRRGDGGTHRLGVGHGFGDVLHALILVAPGEAA